MKKLIYAILTCLVLGAQAKADTILFDFNSAPFHTALPFGLTVGGLTAQFSATGPGGFYVEQVGTLGISPTGFDGLCIYPTNQMESDLRISFSQALTSFSIMYATGETATDSAATMQVTAYPNKDFTGLAVGSATSTAGPPYTWPSGTLDFSSAVGFNSVVVHYLSPPPTGGDYAPVFMVDNMTVKTLGAVVPEPTSFLLFGMGVCGMLVLPRLRRRSRSQG